MTRGPTITYCGSLRALGLGLLLSLVAIPARAAEPADVEALIKQGVELRHKGQDHAALPLFQRAYDLQRSPRTSAQLALAEASLGYFMACERHLEEALSSPRHPWVSRNRPLLEQTLKEVRASIGEIAVSGKPDGAEILVNGKAEGVLPLAHAIRVGEGIAQVTIRAPGFQEQQNTIKIIGGRRETLAVALAPAKGGLVKAVSSDGPRRIKARAPRAAETLNESATADDGSSAPAWVRPAAWVTGGLAVVALTVSGIGYYQMYSNESAFNNRRNKLSGEQICTRSLPNKGDTTCNNYYNTAHDGQRLGLIGVQAGALFAVTSLVGFLWSAGDGDKTATTASAAPQVTAFIDGDTTGAALRLRF